MKKQRSKTKKPGKEVLKLINFKTTEKERRMLKAQAKRHTNGVVSEFIRLVALNPSVTRFPRRSVSKSPLKKAA